MDRFAVNDPDKNQVNFKNALEFIGAVRAGISSERLHTYAVRFSDAFIDMLNETGEARAFLSSRGISAEYVQRNVSAIFARLHLNRENDHYLTLALPRTATEAQIHKRWKELIRVYHPDRNSDEDAAACAKRINEAYSILKNPDKKMEYDRKTANKIEPAFTDRRSKVIHSSKSEQRLLISPEMRRKLPKLILASCTAFSCIALFIIFLVNRPDVYTHHSSALPEHDRQDAGQTHRTPAVEKGELKESTGAGLQAAESGGQDVKTKTDALPEKSQKGKETEGGSAKMVNPFGSHARSAGSATPRIAPSQTARGTSMADTKTGIMEKAQVEGTEKSASNAVVQSASPDQTVKSDISPVSSQKKPAQEQADLPGETTNRPPPAAVLREDRPNLETEVFLFMSQYITAYEEGDIARFMDLFSKSAVENSRLNYADIMQFYKKTFEGSRYTYTLKNVRLQKGDDGVIVSGNYSIRKMTGGDRGLRKDGMIRWTLAKEDGDLKIVKIDYDPK